MVRMRTRRTIVAVLAVVLLIAAAAGGGARRPSVVQDRVPFGDKRKAETRRYSVRHYGRDTFLLRRPRVIVEHYTGGRSYRAARDTFARDVPDVELHELPGLCAHFIVDRRGVIHQLVSTRLMCRHT